MYLRARRPRLMGGLGLGGTESTIDGGTPTQLPSEAEAGRYGDSSVELVVAPGTSVGRYQVLHRLGHGAMGEVFEVYDPQLDRRSALKLLRPGLHARATKMKRMRREAEALAQVSHPNVVQVLDVGDVDGAVYLVMEYIDGTSFDVWLGAQKRTDREVLDVMVAAGRGLVAAHAAGVIHRDFKPQNVMVGADGQVKVVDLGLAKLCGDAGPELSVQALTMARQELSTYRTDRGSIDRHLTHSHYGSASPGKEKKC